MNDLTALKHISGRSCSVHHHAVRVVTGERRADDLTPVDNFDRVSAWARRMAA